MALKMGTRSVLFGAHCFFLHPFFVARAWWKLFGFPWDPRLWFSFALHDTGYLGSPNMDGPEGERHPELGAKIMGYLFGKEWHDLCLYHSRYYAKAHGAKFSKLCVADKLCFALTPAWLYLPMVNVTGEIAEYLKNATATDCHTSNFKAADYRGRQKEWHRELSRYMREWVEIHKDGAEDMWTSTNRNAGAQQ